MKNLSKILALFLCLSMVFCLFACGQEQKPTETTESTTEDTTETTTLPADDGKVTYTVKVTDEAGNPIAGAMVQMCKDACVPAVTDANGVATYNLVEDTYKVSFLSMPAGFAYATEETEFYFEDGATELTIQLKVAE